MTPLPPIAPTLPLWPKADEFGYAFDELSAKDAALRYQRALAAAWESRCRVAVEALRKYAIHRDGRDGEDQCNSYWFSEQNPLNPFAETVQLDCSCGLDAVLAAIGSLPMTGESTLEKVAENQYRSVVRSDTVAGIERFQKYHPPCGDTDPQTLDRCNRCGHEAMYVAPEHYANPARGQYLQVECSNTSCGIRTPSHYKTREAAAKAWNRRAPDGK